MGNMTKQEALDLLGGVRFGFTYGCFAELVARKFCKDFEQEARSAKAMGYEGDKSVSLDLVSFADQLPTHSKLIRSNFLLMLMHQLVKMSYEIALAYCKQSKQTDAWGKAGWLQFARVWRNVLSHGDTAVLTEWPKNLADKGVTEVTWKNRKLAASQVGSEIVDLDVTDAIRLQDDIRSFVSGLN